MSDSDFDGHAGKQGLSRRELLRRGAIGAAAAGALPLVGAGAAQARSGALTPADIATIKKFLGPINPKFSGKGQTWKVGGMFPFSTSASVYGIVQGNGVKLAVKHIEQLGGPTIKMDFRDHAGGDVVKGRNAVIAYESSGIGAIISSFGLAGSAAENLLKKYRILAIDPGGGNAPPYDKLPYFWGMRAYYGISGTGLAGHYIRQKLKGKRVVLVYYDLGNAGNAYISKAIDGLKGAGLEVVKIVKPKYQATDYADALTSIRAGGDFDAISLGIFGFDIAYFLKQYKTSGINKPVFTWEGLLSPTAKIAGSAYDDIYLGGVDDFSTVSKNPWAQIFIKEFRTTFGDSGLPASVPDYYSAGYYDAMFAFWRLYRDVKAKGGDVNDGKQLENALKANPRFPGVLGGGPGAVGFTEFDRVTHSLKHQPMGLYQVRKGVPAKVAESDIGGKNPRIIA